MSGGNASKWKAVIPVALVTALLITGGCATSSKTGRSNQAAGNAVQAQKQGRDTNSKHSPDPQISSLQWKWNSKGNYIPRLDKLKLYRSSNKGKTWTKVVLPIGRLSPKSYVENGIEHDIAVPYFLGDNGWISWINYSSSTLYLLRTSDGGENWTNLSYKIPRSERYADYVSSMQFITPDVGWLLAVSDGGASQQFKYLLKTDNGGNSWRNIDVDPSAAGTVDSDLPIEGTSVRLKFYGLDHGWVSMNNFYSSSEPILFRTDNGGKTWLKVSLPIPKEVTGYVASANVPTFSSSGTGTLVVDFYRINNNKSQKKKVIYATRDGGITWMVRQIASCSSR